MSTFDVVQHFRTRLPDTAETPLRANAPLAIAIGGVLTVCGFALVGPLVSRGSADDAGVLSFLFSESTRRAPIVRQSYAPPPRAYYGLPYAAPARHERLAEIRVHRPTQQRMAKAILKARATQAILATRKAPSAISIVAVASPPPRTLLDRPRISLSPLTDNTLRRGDAVMTAGGIRIFQGAHRYPFTVADFRPLATAGNVAHRGTLLAIDRVRAPTWTTLFTKPTPLASSSRLLESSDPGIRIVDALRRT